jgi:hydroxyacylglutathione hydrolase
VIIDPANPPEVAPTLKDAISSSKINLTAIINTHHHWDHAGGNKEMLKQFPSTPTIIGGKDCDSVTKTPAHNSKFSVGRDISVTALHTPCHTQDSICYFVEDSSKSPPERAVFTGDTLFIGGCGKFFEGTPQQMHAALNDTLASLPDDTRVYPGHEYTKSNVKFLVNVDGENEAVKRLQEVAEREKVTTGKSTIGDEKKWNVFMRVGTEEMRKATGETEESEVMGKLREMKNNM